MTDHPLLSSFVAHVRAALPEDSRLQHLLSTLAAPDVEEVGQSLARQVGALRPELDVVLAMPGSVDLAAAVAGPLNLPVARVGGHTSAWHMETGEPNGTRRGLLVGRELSDGVVALELTIAAQQAGCEVRALACALERSTAQGRHRLLQVGVQTFAAVRVAELPKMDGAPGGWIIERRQLDGHGLRPQQPERRAGAATERR